MNIVVNALSARRGGGQTYIVNLLKYLDDYIGSQIFVLAPSSLILPDNPRLSRIHSVWPLENPFFRGLWERFLLPHLLVKLGADILFCPGGLVNTPLPHRCKAVTMFRNMIPFDSEIRGRYPLGYMRMRNWFLKWAMLKSMKKADLVIFISEFARETIEKRAGKNAINSVTIPHGLTGNFKFTPGTSLPRPDWLPTCDYLLYVSIFDVYKRHLDVVRGYYLLKRRRNITDKLILAGYNETLCGDIVRKEIKKFGLEADVILPGNIPYDDLPAVYHHAKINIFASECENCPNILLEALGAGRPTLVSNKPPMPEFGGDSVVYFDPASPEEFANKLGLIIDAPVEMDMLAYKARKQAELFDWQVTARLTWQAISSLHQNEKEITK